MPRTLAYTTGMFKLQMGFVIITFLSVHTFANNLTGALGQAVGNWGAAVTHDQNLGALNPASIVFTKGYYLNLTKSELNSYRLGILDHMPDTVLPTSFLYSEDRTAQGQLSQRTFVINLAQVVGKKSAVGLGGGYLIRPGMGAQDQSGLIGRLGAIHYLKDNLSLGINWESNYLNAGLNYIIQGVIRLRLDTFKKEDLPLGWSVGAESFMNEWFVLKAGYRWQDQKFLSSWGLSFVGPRLHLNYAHAPDLTTNKGGYVHWLDLSLPLW